QSGLRVHPCERSCKTRVSEARCARVFCRVIVNAPVLQVRLVKTQRPSIASLGELRSRPFPEGLFFYVAPAAVLPHIEIHLHKLGKVIRVGEQSRMSGNTEQHARPFIMYRAVDRLMSEDVIMLRRNNFV